MGSFRRVESTGGLYGAYKGGSLRFCIDTQVKEASVKASLGNSPPGMVLDQGKHTEHLLL